MSTYLRTLTCMDRPFLLGMQERLRIIGDDVAELKTDLREIRGRVAILKPTTRASRSASIALATGSTASNAASGWSTPDGRKRIAAYPTRLSRLKAPRHQAAVI